MNQPQLQRYDFSAAARVRLPLRRKLNAWWQKAADLLVEQWLAVSASEIAASLDLVDAKPFGDISQSWDPLSSSIQVTFGQNVIGMLVAENKQLRVLLLDILGGCDSETTEQLLTSIEISISNLVFEMVAASFSESWMEQQPLGFSLGEFDAVPNRSRQFALDEVVLLCILKVEVSGLPVFFQLVLPLAATCQKIGVKPNEPASKGGRTISTDRIAEIFVELVVSLGSVEVGVQDLADLDAGDIIVLDQSVDEPVETTANGQALFSGWPGRQLNQQVLKLAETLEPIA